MDNIATFSISHVHAITQHHAVFHVTPLPQQSIVYQTWKIVVLHVHTFALLVIMRSIVLRVPTLVGPIEMEYVFVNPILPLISHHLRTVCLALIFSIAGLVNERECV